MPTAVILDPTAKRKQRSKIYGLRTFMDPGCPVHFFGAFRDNIKEFLRQCGDVEQRPTDGMPTWCTLLVDEKTGVLIPLYTVEECVRRSPRPFCDYCRFSGWSHHLVSRRRYHVIIPSDNDWDKPLREDACLLPNHLLHGLLHCNGFGHLLCINGREGGSKFISGRQFMDLWDRLCTSLHVREVTVVDTCRKKSIELRLLLGVVYGAPWFSRWGYQYRMGSFGVTEELYTKAREELASLPLDELAADSGQDFEISGIIADCRQRRRSDPSEPFASLANTRDLLRYLLGLKDRPTKRSGGAERRKRCREFDVMATELDSRWPARRLRVAADVIVGALAERGEMTRQEVRDAARLTIGDTGLLDFVLKSIGNCVVGRHIVRRTSNPATRVLEFRLEEIEQGGSPALAPTKVYEEVEMVCRAFAAARPEAVQAVLDGKHWVKRWGLVDDNDDRLRFLCVWAPGEREREEMTRPRAPPEVVVVEAHASVGDLRREAERAMRDTCCVMEGFRLRRMDGVEGEERDPVMVGGAQSGSILVLRGEGVGMETELRYEGGPDTWAVGCACGARDDDGERMVSCDSCDVWHHTRCIGISDGQPPPPLFLCSRCGSSILGAAAASSFEDAAAAIQVHW